MRTRWFLPAVSAAVLTTLAVLLPGSALAVTITSFNPAGGVTAEEFPYCPGSFVQITGSGFVNDGPASAVSVSFNGTKATSIQIGSDTNIYTTVPAGATSGPITVTTAAGTATSSASNTVVSCPGHATNPPAEVGASVSSAAKASITAFTPARAKAGAKVTISGADFTGASAVKIGGVKATFKVVSGTKITATVPAKAKTGKISVTTAAGTSTSSKAFVKL
jgi:hypothetical protein